MADAANRLVLVRVMPALRDGHFRELYESGDQHVVVSTLIAGQSTNEHVALDGASSRARYPTHAEETAAFRADADGKLMSVESLACAQGSGSRNEVLGRLGLTQARAERPR